MKRIAKEKEKEKDRRRIKDPSFPSHPSPHPLYFDGVQIHSANIRLFSISPRHFFGYPQKHDFFSR